METKGSLILRPDQWSKISNIPNQYSKIQPSNSRPNNQTIDSLHKGISSLYSLPSGASVHLTIKSESNRYDKLKYAAEEIIKEQISSKTEKDLSVQFFKIYTNVYFISLQNCLRWKLYCKIRHQNWRD